MRGTFEEPPNGLIPWFSKIEGNTYATIAASPFPLQGKPMQAQDVAMASASKKEFNRPFFSEVVFYCSLEHLDTEKWNDFQK